MHTYIHTCIHTYIYIYIYIHINNNAHGIAERAEPEPRGFQEYS